MTDKASDLCQEMRRVRQQMDGEVHEIVENVRTLSDWRYHVKRHPWLLLAGAAVVGYLVVPKREPEPETVKLDAATLKELAREGGVVIKTDADEKTQQSLIGMALGFVASAALRSAMTYASKNARSILTKLQQAAHSGHHSQPPSQTGDPHAQSTPTTG